MCNTRCNKTDYSRCFLHPCSDQFWSPLTDPYQPSRSAWGWKIGLKHQFQIVTICCEVLKCNFIITLGNNYLKVAFYFTKINLKICIFIVNTSHLRPSTTHWVGSSNCIHSVIALSSPSQKLVNSSSTAENDHVCQAGTTGQYRAELSFWSCPFPNEIPNPLGRSDSVLQCYLKFRGYSQVGWTTLISSTKKNHYSIVHSFTVCGSLLCEKMLGKVAYRRTTTFQEVIRWMWSVLGHPEDMPRQSKKMSFYCSKGNCRIVYH